MPTGFFPDSADDEELERRNVVFWKAMIGHIRRDGFPTPPRRVLDVGCHRGGLLALVADLWKPQSLIGIEPAETARGRARLRLGAVADEVELFHPDEWGKVANSSVDLVVCHEVLFLIPDLDPFVAQLVRVLAPMGRAYVATGCHTENPLWPEWRARLEGMGMEVFTHAPMDFMVAAGRQGLLPSVRPLRDAGGWATHDPSETGFSFPSVTALLEHQFRHKLLFRFVKR